MQSRPRLKRLSSSSSVLYVCSVAQSVQPFVAPWTVAHQVPLAMEFSRQGYWSGLSFTPSGDLPDSGTETVSLASSVLASGLYHLHHQKRHHISLSVASKACLLLPLLRRNTLINSLKKKKKINEMSFPAVLLLIYSST